MAKKTKSTRRSDEEGPRDPKPIFGSPFKDLKKLIQANAVAKTSLPPTPNVRSHSNGSSSTTQTFPEPEVDEATLLRQALEGVRPLGGASAERITVEPRIARNIVSEDAEVLAELSDLVSGQGTFELTETEEYVEGTRVGIDPRLVTRLRRGEFSVQAHIDLHGMIQVDAKEALTQFILAKVIAQSWSFMDVAFARRVDSRC
jgi:hypothetical protein